MRIEVIKTEKVTYNKTDEVIMDMIADQLSVEREKVTYKSSFLDDLGADSLDQVELILFLEELLDCEISNIDAENMMTVKDIFDYCDREQLSI